jgi:DNA polymerase-1
MKEKIYLVDGSALVFRAHFAFQRNQLLTSDGQNVSAVFGFASALFAVLAAEKARYAAVAFDTAAPTFRHERFGAYKANRPPLPEDLVAQFPIVHELVQTLGLAMLRQEGVEADDLIASLALAAVERGDEAVIVSADKDFNQLIRPGISQWIPPRGREPGVLLGPKEVEERWGVPPERVLDVLALVGDAVDNVPGVKGIGEKTATELIRTYGDLDELYGRLDEIPKAAVREKLVAGRESAYLSRELIRLRTDLVPAANLDPYAVPDFRERPGLLALLQRLEFRRLIESLQLKPAKQWESAYEAVTDTGRLRELLSARPKGAPLAIDTETNSLDPRRAKAVGLSFSWEPGRAYYVPVGHDRGPNVPAEALVEILGPVLGDPAIEKTGQNMKFDMHVFHGLGLEVRGPLFDTLLASYLLDPDRPHDLDTLTLDLLGHRKIPTKELIGSGKTQTTMDRLDVVQVRDYAAEDADAVVRLHGVLLAALRERGQESLLRDLEAPLIPVLVGMERAGVYVDAAQLASFSRELESDIARQAAEVHRFAGAPFNINSPSQLGEVLFEKLKLPHGKKTKTGYSTDSDVLEELAVEQPIARAVLEYRQSMKLRSTYVEALPRLIDPATGRIHAQFNQTVAATGRLSSSDPNLQNIPVRTPPGRRIRRAFAPQRTTDLLFSADYSQIELRILAHLSNDPQLIEAFRSGEDIHAATAARIFDVAIDAVDPAMRARAKTVNFGVLYGMGPMRLSRELSIPLGEARRFIEQYFAKMPAVKGYLEGSLEKARKDGFVSTVLGRRRYLPGLRSEDARTRSAAERVAANTPIQGSAADLIKRAMVRLHDRLGRERLETRLILQVHDELLLEGPAKERERVVEALRSSMEGAIALAVPLKVDVGWGANWDEAHG